MDVARLLEAIGLSQYIELFRANDVDETVLRTLNAQDLTDLGIASLGHRKRLLAAIGEYGPGGLQPSAAVAPTQVARSMEAEAERRQITVLFCDLVGSTALAQAVDPEDLRQIIRRYQDSCAGLIARYGGFLAKFLGDGVLAYFGFPVAHEDDAERAIRSGLEMVAAVAQLESDGRPLAARVGIATGLVVVGDIGGAGEANAVVGETPSLAARLQSEAPPGAVVVSPSTRRLAGGWFAYEDLGSRELKGFARPVPVTRVVGERSTESRFSASRSSDLTPLVGRVEERALLAHRWTLARQGEGQAVLLLADAGLGKSRLAEELYEDAGREGALRLRFQCSPHHTSSALYPVIRYIRLAAGFQQGETAQERLQRLGVLFDAEELPLIAHLLGEPPVAGTTTVELAPNVLKARTLKVLLEHLWSLAAKTPAMVVVEDVHWIDPTTREFLDLVMGTLPGKRVLLLLTARPEFNNTWNAHAHVTALSLSRLGQEQCRQLVVGLAGMGVLADDTVSAIVARADGVPLFLEELTRAVVEAGEGNASAIPETLHDSLSARLDRLSSAKQVAHIGAVIGRDFDYRLVARIADLDEATLRRALEELEGAGLVLRHGVPPESIYTFRHALIRDTAYQSLLRTDQTRLNARVLAALEATPDGSAPELLAHYADEAGARDRASVLWQQAGERSMRRGALPEAIAQFERSLSTLAALGDGADRGRGQTILSRLGVARMQVLGWSDPRVRSTFEQARDAARTLGDEKARVAPLIGLWAGNIFQGRFADCRHTVAELFEVAERTGDEGLVMQAHHAAWPIEFLIGEFASCRRLIDRGLTLYDPVRHADHRNVYFGHDPAACGLAISVYVYSALGLLDSAARASDAAIEMGHRTGHPPTLVHVLDLISAARAIFNYPDAHQPAAEALQLIDQHQLLNYRNSCRIQQGWALAATGESADKGLDAIESAIADMRVRGVLGRLASMLCLQADANLRAGRLEVAQRAVETCLEHLGAHGERWIESKVLVLKGQICLARGGSRSHEAIEAFSAARDIARAQGALFWELVATTELLRLDRTQAPLLATLLDRFVEGQDFPDVVAARRLLAGI